MDFHELEAFVVLAKTLHFARAAATLHTSPSGLSRLLGRLEEELEIRLFERDTRRVELTSEGASFLEFAQETLRRRGDLMQSFAPGDASLTGTLRVYASVTACYTVLPPFAEAIHARHPGLRLEVKTGDPAGAEEAVRTGLVDLGLGALPDEGFEDLTAFSVTQTPLVFVSSSKGPYCDLDFSRGHEAVIASVPLILPLSGYARSRFEKQVKKWGIKPQIAAETAGNEAVLAFARLGLGLGLVPRIVLENSPFAEGLVMYEGGEGFGNYDIGFIMRPSRGGAAPTRLKSAVIAALGRAYPEGSWKD